MTLTISDKHNRQPDHKNTNEHQTGRAYQIEPDCWGPLTTNRSFDKRPTQKANNEDVDDK